MNHYEEILSLQKEEKQGEQCVKEQRFQRFASPFSL